MGLSKLQFTCPAEHFEGKMLFLNNFQVFSTSKRSLNEKVWFFVEKKSDSLVKMELYLYSGRFVELFLQLLSFHITFEHWTSNFCTFDGNFFIRDFKIAFYLTREVFLGLFPQKTVFVPFYRFWVLIRNSSNFCRKVSGRFLEEAFSVLGATCWGKWFSEIFI